MTAKPPPASRPESPQTIQALVKRWRASVVRGTLPASGVTPAAVQQFVDDLDSALTSASVPASGWLPIETAPKDGRAILVSVFPSVLYVSWWQSGGWTFFGSYRVAPQHWMPLPAPPAPLED